MNCDICGKNGELYRTIVEDAELAVCRSCGSLGKVLEKIKYSSKAKAEKPKAAAEPEEIELIAENFSKIIRNLRESLGLTQKEFAKKINEKESFVHKMETGIAKPSISMARKLEKILKVKLIESYTDTAIRIESSSQEGMTVGDFIKVRGK